MPFLRFIQRPLAQVVFLGLGGLLLSSSALADTFGPAPGMTFQDATFDADSNLVPGTATSDFTITDSGMAIDSFSSITLHGLNHTWAGELQISLEKVGTGTSVTLFAPRDDISANLNGDYTFKVDSSLSTLEEALAPLSNDDILTSGTYAPADYGGGTDFGPRTNFTAFSGLSIDGTWRLTATDYFPGDTGSLGSWDMTINTQAISTPDAPSLALLAVGMICLPVIRSVAGTRKWTKTTTVSGENT